MGEITTGVGWGSRGDGGEPARAQRGGALNPDSGKAKL